MIELEFNPRLGVELLHDCKVEIFVGEEGRAQDHEEAQGQNDAHQAAIDNRVHAIFSPSLGQNVINLLFSGILVIRIAENFLHGVQPIAQTGDGIA